jgi:hypothetical protein
MRKRGHPEGHYPAKEEVSKMKKHGVTAVLILAIILFAGHTAWAAAKIKFVNNSDKAVKVTVQAMYFVTQPPDPPTSFTVNALTTLDYTPSSFCLKNLWINDVQKVAIPDNAANPAANCLDLTATNMVVTIAPDGTVTFTSK